MRPRWDLVLLPSLVISLVLLLASQYEFIRASFYQDLGLGRTSDTFDLTNYLKLFTDTFYLQSLYLTIEVAALATLFSLVLGYPIAYVLARSRSKAAMVLLATIVVSSFVTVVIKIFGLIIIFSADGWLNRALLWLGVIDSPYTIVGETSGVVIGLMHNSIGFCVLLLYSVVQTIPPSLEHAAQIHGSGRIRTFRRVVVPLSLPGIIIASLTVFNLNMGAFTSAAIIGGGRILTLPVLIQRTIITEVKYSMGGALAAVLLASVLIINIISVVLYRRMRLARSVVA